MDVELLEESDYTPEWRDNREQAEPIVATLVPLTSAQRQRVNRVSFDESGQGSALPDFAEAVRFGVKLIRNLTVGGKPVTDGRQLLASKGKGLDRLVLELGGEIIRRNVEADLKN